jgi:hypothetical protein
MYVPRAAIEASGLSLAGGPPAVTPARGGRRHSALLAVTGCRWVSFLRGLRRNLAAIAVTFCQHDSTARGQVMPPKAGQSLLDSVAPVLVVWDVSGSRSAADTPARSASPRTSSAALIDAL